jgi:hypothetical protein
VTSKWIAQSLTFAQLPSEVQTVPCAVFFPFQPQGSQVVMLLVFNQSTTVPANLAGSQLKISDSSFNPTATTILTVKTCHAGTWSTLGTISINTSGVATFPSSSAQFDAVAGDAIQVIAQSSADPTFGNFSLNLLLKKV